MTFEDEFPSLHKSSNGNYFFCKDEIKNYFIDKVRVQRAIEELEKEYEDETDIVYSGRTLAYLLHELKDKLGIENDTFSKGDEVASSHIAEK